MSLTETPSLDATTPLLSIFVAGQPAPAGSKKAFARRRRDGSVFASVVDACAKTKSWQAIVAHAAAQAWQQAPLDCPLHLSLLFLRPRPAGHYAQRGGLSAAGRRVPEPIGRPDLLKLARAVEDALTGVVWRDDAQVVQESLVKRWAMPDERGGVMIKILAAYCLK